ncbi:MAG: helix-turn-helix domain-containing protein [Deltaproteobacteria bacterium]|nr:helix-turn-helix domain-containing protein [Deltaproteobacteria bacterium]
MKSGMNMPKPFSVRIKELRTNKGWPAEQLAEVAGLSLKSVQRAETGKSVSLDTLQALASALDVTVDQIINERKEKDASQAHPESQTKAPVVHQLLRLRTGKALLDVVGESDAMQFDHPEPRDREELELIKAISQNLHDTLDVWSEMPPALRVESAFELTEELKKLEKHGLAVFGKSRSVKYTHADRKDSIIFDTAIVVIQRTDHPTIVRVNEETEILPVVIKDGPLRF